MMPFATNDSMKKRVRKEKPGEKPSPDADPSAPATNDDMKKSTPDLAFQKKKKGTAKVTAQPGVTPDEAKQAAKDVEQEKTDEPAKPLKQDGDGVGVDGAEKITVLVANPEDNDSQDRVIDKSKPPADKKVKVESLWLRFTKRV